MPGPSPEQLDYANMLLERAASDSAAVHVLITDEDMLDDVVGFHAQQAVEKALKVFLTERITELPAHKLTDVCRALALATSC